MDVLQAEKLPPQLREIILYALAFANAAQPPHGERRGIAGAALEGQGLPQSARLAGDSSAATERQQPETQYGDSKVANAYSSSYPAQRRPQAADCSYPHAHLSQDCLSNREDASQRQNSSQQGNLSAATSSSKGLMTHAKGMEALAQYMRSAGR